MIKMNIFREMITGNAAFVSKVLEKGRRSRGPAGGEAAMQSARLVTLGRIPAARVPGPCLDFQRVGSYHPVHFQQVSLVRTPT